MSFTEIKCKECGEEFTPKTHNQIFCKKDHYRKCIDCGDELLAARIRDNPLKCGAKGRCKNFVSKEALKKQAAKSLKVPCSECSLEFTPARSTQKVCPNEHERVCVICGDLFAPGRAKLSKDPKVCTPSCGSAFSHLSKDDPRRSANNRVTVTASGEKIFDSFSKPSLKKCLVCSKEFNAMRSRQKTCSRECGDKIAQTSREETFTARYGVNNPAKLPESIKKASETLMKTRGVPFASQVHMKNVDEWNNFALFLENLEENKFTSEDLSRYFNVSINSIYTRMNLPEYTRYKNKLIYQVSKREEKFKEFLNENHSGVEVRINDRSVISPKELDFYLPEHKLAVEVSPTRTHNSLTGSHGSEEGKPKNYHLAKFLACEEQGIELMTIFDWMPWDKTLEMISHKLSGTSNKVGANKTRSFTVVKDNSQKSKKLRDFIAENHVLGFSNTRGTEYFSYLESKGTAEILAVAAWGFPSSFRNKSKASAQESETTETKEGVSIELKRLVFRKGYSIPGGASKLLKSFERSFEELSGKKLSSIFTFSDCDLGTGKIYETLGFSLVEAPKPGLNFVSPIFDQPSSPGTAWRIKANSLALQGTDRLLRNLPGYTPVGLVCTHLLEDSSENPEGTSTESTSNEVKREHPNGECLPSNQDIVRAYGFFDVHDCGYKKWQKVY